MKASAKRKGWRRPAPTWGCCIPIGVIGLTPKPCLQRSLAIAQRIAHPYELAQSHMNLGRLYLFQERLAGLAPAI